MTSTTAAPATSNRNWVLFILALTYLFNYVDRSILNIAGEAVRIDLKLTDTQLGLVGGLAYSLINGMAAIPIAWWADRTNRVKLVAGALAIWSLVTAACGAATNFWQMFVGRTLVGFAEAAGPSASQSVISDYFPASQRARAMSLYYLGVPVGILLGAFVIGLMVEHFGWRMAFVLVGLPGVLLAALMYFTVKEPPRGQFDTSATKSIDQPSLWATMKLLFSRATYRHLLLAVVLLNFAALAFMQFLHPFLVRRFDMGYADAAAVFGLVKGVAAIIGGLIGGFASSYLAQRDERFYAWVPGIGVLLAGPLYILALMQGSWQISAVLLFLASIGHSTYYGPFFATVHSICGARMRTMATAISAAIINGIGITAGPVFAGLLSDFFTNRAFGEGSYKLDCVKQQVAELASSCQAASASGLQTGLTITALVFVWAALHYFLGSNTFRRDVPRSS